MRERSAVYAGSFNPFHNGHLAVVKAAAKVFDFVTLLIADNPEKPDAAREWKEHIFDALQEARIWNSGVDAYSGLTTTYARDHESLFLVRGLRSGADVDYEYTVCQVNKMLDVEIETVLIMPPPELAFISSRVIRGLIKSGVSVRNLVPKPIYQYLELKK